MCVLEYIEGQLVEIGLLHIVVEVGGFGYRVNAPITTIDKLPPTGNTIKLHLSEQIREDRHEIFGFCTKQERDFFEILVNHVSGVGPRLALTIMSHLSISTLRSAIAARDTTLLSGCHGIGKKTAERIIVELADKLDISDDTQISHAQQPVSSQDALSALISLGYKTTEADKAIQRALGVLGESATAEELIKHALHS